MNMLIKIGLGAVAALIAVVGIMWVVGLGPFNIRPSPAAKVQAKVAATVPKVQAQENAAVSKAEDATKAKAATNENRTETHVANVRATPHPAGGDFPDHEFFVSVCESELYAGDPDCRGVSGGPEGVRPAALSRKVRRR